MTGKEAEDALARFRKMSRPVRLVNRGREDLEAARDTTHTAHEMVQRLTEQQRAHICEACPVRDEHRRNLGVLERLTRERQILADRAAQESQADDAQTRNLIRGVAAVLLLGLAICTPP